MAGTVFTHLYAGEAHDVAARKTHTAAAARAAAFHASEHRKAVAAAARRQRLARLAETQDGPGPDTPRELACVGHEDEIQCAGVEQGDVARHYHGDQTTSPYTMSKKEAWDIYEQRKAYFTKHPPHRATQAECPAGTHPVGQTGACA